MARISDGILPGNQTLALTIDRYQEIMRLPINAFNGLNNPDEVPVYECSTIWKQSERDNLAMFLAQSEEMRELELGYHIAPKYLEDEEHRYSVPIILDRKYLVAVGVVATTDIQDGVVLALGIETAPNDPVEFDVDITGKGVANSSEVCVYYPGESVKIYPSSISISGNTATIKIPRARLVKPALNDNRDNHLDYYENDNFLEAIDVKRYYTETSGGAYIVWGSPERMHAGHITYPDASETTQHANVQIMGNKAYKLGIVHCYPATATLAGAYYQLCVQPRIIRISYLSGRQSSMKTEMETARLAHVLMPNMPCTCPYVQQYWIDDRTKDPSGLVTPYGNESGAVRAWLSDSRAKIGQGGTFPGMRD